MAVLQAPPGAGKTTRVPLAMTDAAMTTGRILMLEPRRLAARTAAARMASTLGEDIGATVGFRIRGEARVSKSTKIEVVTEGILTRMLQSDPALTGIGAVIFDEFHERSLNADLGLALTLEVRAALREDLILLVMSATLDAGPVAELMGGAPLVTSAGQSFPVQTHWLDKPLPKTRRFEDAAADLVTKAGAATDGGMLVFLPGEGEIRRVAAKLDGRLGGDTQIMPLYGAMPFAAQQNALRPLKSGRKIVLATSIAETSLTIPDIRIVVDAGQARRARFDAGSGMSRLVTERVTRAEADQRRGRAGRVAAGQCFRMWTKGEEGALAAYPPAEIEAADLTSLALELAEWGSDELPFLTRPPDNALNEARALLVDLGALSEGRITDHGRKLAAMPLHPRLAHMLSVAGKPAAPLAALLSDRDPLRGAGVDLALRIAALKNPANSAQNANRGALERLRAEARRLEKFCHDGAALGTAEQAALAFPDRIGLRRPGDEPRYLLSGGKGAVMASDDALAGARLIVVTDTDGHPRDAKIRQAIDISESQLRDIYTHDIKEVASCYWSKRDRRIITQIEERLGKIALSTRAWHDASNEDVALAMLDGIREMGLPSHTGCDRFRARVALARAAGHDLPDVTDDALLATLEAWLLPHLSGVRSASDWRNFKLIDPLKAMLNWDQTQLVNRIAPANFTTPLGRSIAIDYSGDAPEITLRLQEMFGTTQHPVVAGRPLRVTFLSPAGRPIQTTMDVPGFWASSYCDVRKDMRGRYPKHPWPEDPTAAPPTLRTKKRGPG